MKISDEGCVVTRVKAAPRALFKALPNLLEGDAQAVVIKGFNKATGPFTASYHAALTRYVLAKSGYNLTPSNNDDKHDNIIDISRPQMPEPIGTNLVVWAFTMAEKAATLKYPETRLSLPGPFAVSDTVLVVGDDYGGEVIEHDNGGLYLLTEIGFSGYPVHGPSVPADTIRGHGEQLLERAISAV